MTSIDGGAGFRALMATIRADIAGVQGSDLAARLGHALDRIEAVTAALAGQVAADPDRGLANATLYLDAMGHVVMGWMWLRLTRAASRVAARDGDSAFLRGKHQAARYFLSRELSRVDGWCDVLTANDQSAFDMDAEWF